MATIVSDPTITQTESLWQTVRTVRRRQGSGGEPCIEWLQSYPIPPLPRRKVSGKL
ncbi:hypothetical protein N4Q65_10700 [Salmonella enterica subsp. enterica serovar Pomona]